MFLEFVEIHPVWTAVIAAGFIFCFGSFAHSRGKYAVYIFYKDKYDAEICSIKEQYQEKLETLVEEDCKKYRADVKMFTEVIKEANIEKRPSFHFAVKKEAV